MPVKTKGLGPRTAFGGVKNPELTPAAGKVPQRKVMKDGSSNRTWMKDPKTGKTVKVTGWTNPYAVKPKK